MNSLLVIDSSARVTRSLTRRLTRRFAEGWRSRLPGARIVHRDVGLNPPAPVDEKWIAAAFRVAAENSPEVPRPLAVSETLINELWEAGAVVMGVPMYNFGVPAQLKAYIDQIVRVGRTFRFDPGAADPYIPLIPSKPVVVVSATGAGGYEPGGPFARLNFLDPHLEAVLGFIGLSDIRFVRVGFDEFHDGRREQALAAAEAAVDRLVGELTGWMVAEEAASAGREIGGGSWPDVRETPVRSS